MLTKTYPNRSGFKGVTLHGLAKLEAHPSEANTYAWFALRHSRMYVYGGRTQNGLNNRLMNPYGDHAVSHRVLELLRKATGKSYTAGDLTFRSTDITVIKSSKKNNSAEDEQKVINACWKFEQDVADSHGHGTGLVFSLNAQGVDRSTRYCQETYDALQEVFNYSFTGTALLPGRSVLKKALVTLSKLKVTRNEYRALDTGALAFLEKA